MPEYFRLVLAIATIAVLPLFAPTQTAVVKKLDLAEQIAVNSKGRPGEFPPSNSNQSATTATS